MKNRNKLHENLLDRLRAGVVALVFIGVVASEIKFALAPKPAISVYFLAKDAVSAKTFSKIEQFISPDNLRLERIDNTFTNVSGWFTLDSGNGHVSTQWFKCKIISDRDGVRVTSTSLEQAQ